MRHQPQPPNPHDALAIQNTLARYCEALDTKNWALLHSVRLSLPLPPYHPNLRQVFTPHTHASYPFSTSLKGATNIAAAIKNRFVDVFAINPHLTKRLIGWLDDWLHE